MKFQVFNFDADLRVERELVHSIVTINRCLQIILLKSKAEMNNILSLYTNCTNVYSSSSQIFLFAELERSITPFTMKRTVINSRFYRMLILVERNFWMPVWLTLVFSQSALLTKSFVIRNIRISVAFHRHILIF